MVPEHLGYVSGSTSYPIETSVRTQHMQMWMPAKEIAERMDGDNRPWNCVLFRGGFLEELLQGLPGATAEFRKERAVVEEIPA